MASGLKTAAWTAITAVAGVAVFTGAAPIIGSLVAIFSAAKAWQSHKENQAEEAQISAPPVSRSSQEERALAIAQYRGQEQDLSNGRNWSEDMRSRAADRTTQL